MFVNVRVMVGQLNRAYLVPQIAVLRDATGPFVQIVNAENKVEQRRISTLSTQGDKWIVSSGLADGERVIVSGIQSAPVGAEVKVCRTSHRAQTPWMPLPSSRALTGATMPVLHRETGVRGVCDLIMLGGHLRS
jgi:membrane fusion protein (multidrug efflux system)